MANSKNTANNSNGKSFRAIITSTPAWIGAIATLIGTIIAGLVALGYLGDGGDRDGGSAPSNQENISKPSGTTPTRVPGGALCQTLADQIGARGGVCVVEVIPGSPAATAGVKVGDLITAVGGRSVEDVDEFDMLVDQTPTGERVILSIVRDEAPKIYVRVKLERIEGSKLSLGVVVEDTVPQQRPRG